MPLSRLAHQLRRLRGIAHELQARGFRRAARRLLRAVRPPPVLGYDAWITRFDAVGPREAAAVGRLVAALRPQPHITVIVYGEADAATTAASLDSLSAQLYGAWSALVVEPTAAGATTGVDARIGHLAPGALPPAVGDAVAFVAAGDRLAPHALAVMAVAMVRHPGAEVLYSDEDLIDTAGRRSTPYFKPDWNRELARHQDYLSRLGVVVGHRAGRLSRVPGSAAEVAALLGQAAAASVAPVVHVPHVLYHRRAAAGAIGPSVSLPTTALPGPTRWPRVTAVIPTRDHAELLATCVAGLLEATDYPDLEIVVADNGSVEPQTAALLAELGGRGVVVVDAPGPFNYARINNSAAAKATGEILLFLNNDIEVVEPGWLKAMVAYACRPGIGAVGAKLLYPDGTLQHGGVVLGLLGVAGHVHLGAAGDAPGHGGRLLVPQDVSCVTAACLAMPRAVFAALGGFDETHLGVAFNDVDLCLRVRAAGYRIIWTPTARLVHHESKSRGSDRRGAKLIRFQDEMHYMYRRWGGSLDNDPFWSPNLSLDATTPRLAVPPRIARPWHRR
ncbi:glycosyltransferase family 2 protein [Chelatococcus reniformis]|uniref:Glycosyltransferase 2-like domain-containing protein n=1 Tax=Chelatococcus reniformis TaxID=1494448 RepID=A0A916TYR6_9HYPH|nr:glycosyltransferase family 2 protein [Chelatococcus reniformis]GGC51394.1 hypothetical protein GCM10010994_08120 [Chelatococcus reniformis]